MLTVMKSRNSVPNRNEIGTRHEKNALPYSHDLQPFTRNSAGTGLHEAGLSGLCIRNRNVGQFPINGQMHAHDGTDNGCASRVSSLHLFIPCGRDPLSGYKMGGNGRRSVCYVAIYEMPFQPCERRKWWSLPTAGICGRVTEHPQKAGAGIGVLKDSRRSKAAPFVRGFFYGRASGGIERCAVSYWTVTPTLFVRPPGIGVLVVGFNSISRRLAP